MRVGTVPENPVERLALAAQLVPTPVVESLGAFGLARVLMAATRMGLFERLADGPLPLEALAKVLGAQEAPLRRLLSALVGMGYLRWKRDAFSLSPSARKWLLEKSPSSVRDHVLFLFTERRWIDRLEDYVLTGTSARMHEELSPEEWETYQRAMRASARLSAPEVVRRSPVPKGATSLLDIGGAHGFFSVAFCRRHPTLEATVLDLPAAVEKSAPLLAEEGMGARVRHVAGDARTAELGEARHDLVFIGQLIHHFDAETNRALFARAAKALKPGGSLVVMDLMRPVRPGEGGQVGALTDLFFALTSQAGTYSPEEISGWQREAGLEPGRLVRMITLPGGGLISARRR